MLLNKLSDEVVSRVTTTHHTKKPFVFSVLALTLAVTLSYINITYPGSEEFSHNFVFTTIKMFDMALPSLSMSPCIVD